MRNQDPALCLYYCLTLPPLFNNKMVGGAQSKRSDLFSLLNMLRRTVIWGPEEKVAICKPAREASPENKPCWILIWDFRLQNCGK